MNDFEFINYLETPDEKYFMGIACVRLYGKIVLKYKIVERKDGSSFFIAPPSYRLPLPNSEDFKYIDAFMIDSRMEHEELQDFIRSHVDKHMNSHSVNQPQQQQQQPPPPSLQHQEQQQVGECPF